MPLPDKHFAAARHRYDGGLIRRHGAALLSSALLVLPLSLLPVNVLAQSAEETPSDTTLTPIVITGGDSALGPDKTIVAKSARTSSKTDTPLLDSPASVSVVTEQELNFSYTAYYGDRRTVMATVRYTC